MSKMRTYFSDDELRSANPSGVKLNRLASNSLVGYLSYIDNPILLLVVGLFQLINHIWGLIATVLFIKYMWNRCKRNRKSQDKSDAYIQVRPIVKNRKVNQRGRNTKPVGNRKGRRLTSA